jgi:acyl-CoA dehydrogenase
MPGTATGRCTTWDAAAAWIGRAEGALPAGHREGELRLQSMGVTEPTAGTDTTSITTSARRAGDRYVVNGQKVWISRVHHSDLMILLARTSPAGARKSEGLSIFLVDLRTAIGKGLTVRPSRPW